MNNQTRSRVQNRWLPPPNNFYKVNCNANLKQGYWDLGAIVRDNQGASIAAATWRIKGGSDAMEAETTALMYAVTFAKELCLRRVCMESDCESLIKEMKNSHNHRTVWGKCIRRIRSSLSQFEEVVFSHIRRENNQVAHVLARLVHRFRNNYWIEDVPMEVQNHLYFDIHN